MTVRSETKNQRGENTMPGTAVVALPARTGDRRPVTRRLAASLKRADYLAEVVPDFIPLGDPRHS